MAIHGPESRWQKFKKTPAVFDVLTATLGAGGFLLTAGRFFVVDATGWGWLALVLAFLVAAIQGFKARATLQEQERKDSIHELEGCLHTLEAALLGPDLNPGRRARTGLRLTIHVPDVNGTLKQAMDYVGDQRSQETAGRLMPENAGVVGQAYRQAKLDPTRSQLFYGCRTSHDYDAFIEQMVDDYAFSPENATRLNPATMSWSASAITYNDVVYGVLYCDAKTGDFFTPERRQVIQYAMAGIAYFVGLRYD